MGTPACRAWPFLHIKRDVAPMPAMIMWERHTKREMSWEGSANAIAAEIAQRVAR